jgi:hypothetical protein
MDLLPNAPLLFRIPLMTALLLWLAVALGYRFVKLVRVPTGDLSSIEHGFLCLTLGAGLLQFLPFTMGALRLLSISNLRLAVGGLAVLLAADAIQVGRHGWAAIRKRLHQPRSRVEVLWLSLLLLFLGALFVRGLIERSIPEDDGYHLMAPKRWLQAGALDYLPTYTHTNSPMGFEMLYMIALVFGGAALAKALHLVAGALCFLGVLLLAKRFGYRAAGAIAVSFMLIENRIFDLPVLLNKIYVDFAMCWMMLAALLLWRIWCEHHEPRLLACSALCAGFAGSFKFIALSMGAALIVLILLELKRSRVDLRSYLGPLSLATILSCLPILPWLWRNWRLTGNPVYPMLSSLIPTRDWSPEHAQIFERFFHFYNWEQTLSLSEPLRKELLLLGASLILALHLFLILRVKQRALRDLACFSLVLALGALGTTGLYYRFLMPTIFCLALIAACLCCLRWRRESGQMLWAVAIMVLALGKWGAWARRDVPAAALIAAGLRPETRDDQFWNVWRYLNENTPHSARVLIGAFCSSFKHTSGIAFWVDRTTYTTDSHLQAFLPMNSWPSFVDRVRKERIDFMVLADSASPDASAICSNFAFFSGGKNEYRFNRMLADEYGTKVYQSGDIGVYRLGNLASAPLSAR